MCCGSPDSGIETLSGYWWKDIGMLTAASQFIGQDHITPHDASFGPSPVWVTGRAYADGLYFTYLRQSCSSWKPSISRILRLE